MTANTVVKLMPWANAGSANGTAPPTSSCSSPSVPSAEPAHVKPKLSRTAGMSSAHHSLTVKILRNSAVINLPISPDLHCYRCRLVAVLGRVALRPTGSVAGPAVPAATVAAVAGAVGLPVAVAGAVGLPAAAATAVRLATAAGRVAGAAATAEVDLAAAPAAPTAGRAAAAACRAAAADPIAPAA